LTGINVDARPACSGRFSYRKRAAEVIDTLEPFPLTELKRP